MHKSVRIAGCVLALFVAGCTESHTFVDFAAVTIAPEVESDPAKAAIAVTYLNTVRNAKQAYFEADRTDAAEFKKAEDDLILNYEGAALDDLLKLRASFTDTVKRVGWDIRVNAVTVDEAMQNAILTTDETWAVADQAESDLFRETHPIRTVNRPSARPSRPRSRPAQGEGHRHQGLIHFG